MRNEIEQIAQQNDMSIEFVTWFFNEKKVGCGNVWFMMMAAMWEGWKGRSIEMDKLAAENVALALENVAMKQIVDSVTNLDNEPQYHDEGMGCGLEDRGITDRYDACRYGWDEAMERIYGEVIPCADELDFSATDRIVAGIKADAQSEVIEWLDAEITAIDTMYRGDPSYERDANWMKSEVLDVVELARKAFSAQLREGADK